MKRRLLGLILVGAMIFSLSACGKNEVQQESDVQQEDNVWEEEPASDPNDEGDTAEKEEVKLTSTEMTDITFTKTDSAVIMNISGETFQIFQKLATKNDTENPQGAIAQMDFHFWNETAMHYYVYVAYIGHGQYACLEQEFDKKVHNDVPFEMTETGISVSLTPELVDISNLGLFGVNIQSKDESYYVEDLYACNVDGKLMVTKDSESIATNDAMLQVAEQNNEQAVDQGQIAEATQSQVQSDKESFSYVGVTFKSEEGNTLVINEVDAEGYPTSMTFDGKKEKLPERGNFIKTDNSWSLGVVWSRDDYGNQLFVSDIGYENFNGNETILIHGAYGGDYKLQK